jgi:hypothetical protein
MDGRDNGAERPRVAVLSRDPTLGSRLVDACANGIEGIQVTSPYEAAAEILAAPVAVLVIDLPAMAPAHLPLLDLARKRGVEMLGTGSLPGGIALESLSRVRLMAFGDLPSELERLTGAEAATKVPAVEPVPAAEAEPAEPPVAEPHEEAPAEPAREPAKRKPAKRPVKVPAKPKQAAPRPDDAAEDVDSDAAGTRGLLTPEEIAALLENEP